MRSPWQHREGEACLSALCSSRLAQDCPGPRPLAVHWLWEAWLVWALLASPCRCPARGEGRVQA